MKGQRDGVIVASNQTQEWLLKWWWKHYSKENAYPVTFFDLGMSKSAQLWCLSKGALLSFSFPKGSIAPIEEIEQSKKKLWEAKYPGDLWEGRKEWFAKPFLLLKSPHKRTIWMDLDCEVRKPIAPLFAYADTLDQFSIMQLKIEELEVYNTGVIVCDKHSPIPKKWAEHTLQNNQNHFGDETLLMEAVEKEGLKINPHPMIYNWPTILPQNEESVIRHHIGGNAKMRILETL